MKLTAGRLAELQVGTVLRLPMPRHEASVLKVGGLPLAAAWPVRIGEHRGARLAGHAAVANQGEAQPRLMS